MVYKNTNRVFETRERIEVFNRLLGIKSFDDMTLEERESEKEHGIKEPVGLYEFLFEDGTSIMIDLYRGSENYYDSILYQKGDGEPISLDCLYEIRRKAEFTVDGNTYVCELEIERERTETELDNLPREDVEMDLE